MTIRQFSVQPCPDCKVDTTHHAMKCRECGHINLTNFEAAQRAKVKLFAQRKHRVLWKARAIHADQLRRARRAIPTGSLERV